MKQQKEIKDKDKMHKDLQDTIQKQALLIEQANENLKQVGIQTMDKEMLFKEYKERSLQDFAYKESQILELHNKISDLEDEKFRLLHFSKDKDKKKFHAMDMQIKQFTNELHKLTQENAKLKHDNEKKEEDLKHLQDKVYDLESKVINFFAQKSKSLDVVSIANSNNNNNCTSTVLDSQLCTPISMMSSKGYRFQSINDVLTSKFSKDKNDSANNSFNAQHKVNSPNLHLNSPKNNNTPKIMKIVKGGNNQIQIQLGNNIYKPETKSLTPTNNKEIPSINFNDYNSNHENIGFDNKLLQNSVDAKKLVETKRSINEKMKKDKLDFEMKILEEDFNDDYPKERRRKRKRKTIFATNKKENGDTQPLLKNSSQVIYYFISFLVLFVAYMIIKYYLF